MHSTENASFLPRPSLPQAVGGALDVGGLDGNAVQVYIPAYPQCNLGDRITLVWVRQETGSAVVRRYAHLANPGQALASGEYEMRVLPLWALLPGDYEVRYAITSRTGNRSQSEATLVTVRGTPVAPTVVTGGVIQSTLFGTYQPGVVATLIVPDTYVIDAFADGAILASSLARYSVEGKSTPNAVLQLYKNEEGNSFANIVSDHAGTAWAISMMNTIRFERGDLVSIRLGGEQNSAIFLMLAM